jgi:RNA polymerase sigma-70 factor (ECF subfamily)
MTERDPAAASRTGEVAAAEQMTAAARGDTEAFLRLCDGYAPMLMGVALRIVGDRNESEKAVHEVLVEAWRSARVYDPARFSVLVWWTIGVRTMALRRSQGRRVKRMASTHDTMIAQLGPAVEANDVPPQRAKVRRVLDALTSEQRSLLQLAYFDGLSPVEIGDRSHMNAGQVRSHLAEALRCLRGGLFWIDAPRVGPADELAAGYLLGELSGAERTAVDLGDPVHGLEAAAVALVRDTVHSLALYTMPGPAPKRIRTRVHAAITGPDRMQPFAVDLARFFAVDMPTAREYIGLVDRPHGWLDEGAGVRLLALRPGAGSAGASNMSEETPGYEATIVQAPAWPPACLVRLAPGQSLGVRYPSSGATALVLQGTVLGDDGRSARAGETWRWAPGAALGTASPGEVELICALRAGDAQA